MKVLNIFVDESGDFGIEDNSVLYVVSLVFHEQTEDIQREVKNYKNLLNRYGIKDVVHIANIVNNNKEGKLLKNINDRRSYYKAMKLIVTHLDIKEKTFIVEKKYCNSFDQILYKLGDMLFNFIDQFDEYLRSFEIINIYYDNGQGSLKTLLYSVFRRYNAQYPQFELSNKLLPHIADYFTYEEKILFLYEQNGYSLSKRQFNFFIANKKDTISVLKSIKKDLNKKRLK